MVWVDGPKERREPEYQKAIDDILNLKTDSDHTHLKAVIEYFKTKNINPSAIKFITLTELEMVQTK